MHIGEPELRSEDGAFTWSATVRGLQDSPDRLWFRLPNQYADLITHRTDPALIGLLVPAMHQGEPLVADGPVTDELVHSLTHGYQHILETVIPALTRVPVEAPGTVPASAPASGVATGFSAGVDSYAVIAEHRFRPVPEDLRLTHLTFFNVGSHYSGESGRLRFRRRYELLAPTADEIGLPFIPVDSNLDDFFAFSTYQQTYGPRNISAASLLQGGIGRYYFAGSFAYAHTGVRRSHDTAFADPIALPLLTTRAFRPTSHGNQYTRVEKTLIVADTPASYTSLNVCVAPASDGTNCSKCPKCLRTELTLEIAGRLAEYRTVFDLDVYAASRSAYLDRVVLSDDEFAAEIREQALRAGYPMPRVFTAAARSSLERARRRSRSLAHRVFGRR